MTEKRLYFFLAVFLAWAALVWARFFYWQVVMGEKLAAAETNQAVSVKKVEYPRGEIFTADGNPFVLNQKIFSLYLWKPALEIDPSDLAKSLSYHLFPDSPDKVTWENEITSRLKKNSQPWILLEKNVTQAEAEEIQTINLKGLFLEEMWGRFYPEASSAAHLLGFLGKDEDGKPRGYFGLEGFWNLQLQGFSGLKAEKSGWWNLAGNRQNEPKNKGKDLYLFTDRVIQFIAEDELEKGAKRYGAKIGTVIVIDPENGGILAMAAWPKYDPAFYYNWSEESFPNPNVAKNYEPGSVIKPIVVASALQEGVVEPDSVCPICDGPIDFGDNKIKTWNEKYYPQSTVTEIIQHSDNVGMVWIQQKLGLEKMLHYFDEFNLGKKTGIDLEEESFLPLKKKSEWYPLEVATAAFGQGIAATPIQIASAFVPLANGGRWIKPRVVAKIIDSKGDTVNPFFSRTVIDEQTSRKIKEILVNAVDKGEAKWAKPEGFRIAGKTGTAQIPISGKYDQDKTIASFAGFAPADNPRFVMLVTLFEPTSSPWGSETAAPLWFGIAKRLFFYLGITPEINIKN